MTRTPTVATSPGSNGPSTPGSRSCSSAIEGTRSAGSARSWTRGAEPGEDAVRHGRPAAPGGPRRQGQGPRPDHPRRRRAADLPARRGRVRARARRARGAGPRARLARHRDRARKAARPAAARPGGVRLPWPSAPFLDARAVAAYRKVVERERPDVIQLEHWFLAPLIGALDPGEPPAMVLSLHNVASAPAPGAGEWLEAPARAGPPAQGPPRRRDRAALAGAVRRGGLRLGAGMQLAAAVAPGSELACVPNGVDTDDASAAGRGSATGARPLRRQPLLRPEPRRGRVALPAGAPRRPPRPPGRGAEAGRAWWARPPGALAGPYRRGRGGRPRRRPAPPLPRRRGRRRPPAWRAAAPGSRCWRRWRWGGRSSRPRSAARGSRSPPASSCSSRTTPTPSPIAIVRLLDSPGERESLAAAGRALVEREYDWDRSARLLLEAHDRAALQSRKRRAATA